MKRFRPFIAALLCIYSTSAQILETEPNDDFTTANFFAAGDTMQGKTCAYPQADYFQIILPDDGILRIFTSISANTPNPINLTFDLYSKNQSSFNGQSPITGADSIAVTDTLDWGCMAADTFYLRIAAQSSGFGYCWDYQISYEVIPPVFSNDAEPNGTPAQAIDLPYNTPAEGHLGFNIVPGLSALNEAEDYYRIITPTDGIIRVFVTAENAGASVSLSVSLLAKNNGSFGDQYPPVGGSGVAATDTLYWGCQAADTFFLRFFINNITYCGFSYHISYDVLPAYFANDVEPNGTPAQAINLPYNTPAEGHLGYRIYTGSGSSADPADYYKIVTPVSGVLRIFIASEMAGVPTYSMPVSLYSKTNGWFGDQYFLPGSYGIPNSDTMAWACIDADTFFLQVSINNVLDCGISYQIWYEMDSAAYAEDAEPNNTYATASPLPYNTPEASESGMYCGRV